ncbi:MAG: hypothetical protein KIH65_000970 [Candidatus Uhrbacteria bacterium]|nr:hypothetical protein [Candidatus Uhrbacteria bacterium]
MEHFPSSPQLAKTSIEKKMEQFPSKEDVTAIFEKILKGATYTEVRCKYDGETLIMYEIETTDETGDKVEYNYQKAKVIIPELGSPAASIHAVMYDGDMPVSSDTFANLINGEWKFCSAE